ncbi:MAG: hypothetical protein PVI52_07080 [Chromatiales bacterium]|jgi:hypothetical protein
MWMAAGAFEGLELSIAELSTPDWRAQQLHFSFAWQPGATAGYRLEIDRLELPSLEQTLTGVRVDCRQGEVSGRRIRCDQGELLLQHPLVGSTPIGFSFDLDRESGDLNGTLDGVGLAGGRLDLQFDSEAAAWQLQLQGRRLNPTALLELLPQQQRPLADWTHHSRADLEARLHGQGGTLQDADWQLVLAGLAFADATGTTAGEGLAGRFDGRLTRTSERWVINGGLILDQGELLTPVCYLDATAHPLDVSGEWALDRDLETLRVRAARLRLPDLLDLRLQARLALPDGMGIRMLKLRLQPFPVGDVYRELLQPVLQGTPWGRFELAGEADLALDLQDGMAALALGLQDVALDDTRTDQMPRRLGLYDVNGQIVWNRSGEMRPSWLAWGSGQLLDHIELGPARIDFRTAGERFELMKQIRLPVLDGFLLVDRLDLAALGTPEQELQFDGILEPISMSALSQALGWLPLSGKLSGMLPGLHYKKGLFSIDGILLVRIFDGDILIKNLRLQDLFGVYPQLSADIEMKRLDLDQLTSTFSFGKITGRLDGYVRDLRLEDWRPISFDARFYTPTDDESRRRISQRAVDNISNLGGAGLSGSLTRGFLGMFESFSYRRLGIGCRLHDGRCEMVGAAPAKQGYYLMEGSGIPRIDIIGYNKTADWERLVEQLKQIPESGSPVIQ